LNCHEVNDSLESYITGDLGDLETSRVAEHLKDCPACAVAYEETRLLVGELKDLRCVFQPDHVFEEVMSVTTHVKQGEERPRRRSWAKLWAAAAAVLLLAAIGAVAVVTVPSLAQTVPTPVGNRLEDLERENRAVHEQNEAMQERIDKLEESVRELTGDEVAVVATSEDDLSDEVTMAVQQVVIEFIKAQYAGDLQRMKELATPALKERIDQRPEEYLRDDAGTVSFAQMTDVGIYEGLYVTFVRLSDTEVFSDSQYQENFGVKEVGGGYLIEWMEMDA
jgi:cell division protein FtsB